MIMQGKKGLIMGLANKFSIAYGISESLKKQGAELVFTAQTDYFKDKISDIAKEFGGHEVILCDVSKDGEIESAFNKILDEVENKADYSEYKPEIRNYLAHKSRLHNLSVVLGSAGAGKTMGVIKNTLNTLTGSTDTDIAFIAGEDNQAKKVAASAGYDNNY